MTESFYVDSATLRRRFGELNILARLESGELREEVAREWPAPSTSGQPKGTFSQRVRYFDNDVLIAIVHQYKLPDGTRGASGLPDPKWLREGDTILLYRH